MSVSSEISFLEILCHSQDASFQFLILDLSLTHIVRWDFFD